MKHKKHQRVQVVLRYLPLHGEVEFGGGCLYLVLGFQMGHALSADPIDCCNYVTLIEVST